MFDRLKNIISSKKTIPEKRIVHRGYDAARSTRWTADFLTELGTINREIKNDLVAVRNRARSLWKNSSIVRAYRKRLISDVIGRDGFKLQMRVKTDSGEVDKIANNILENGWYDYCKKENCTMSKSHDMVQSTKLLIEHYKRDGEFICRFIEDSNVNKYGFSIELIEPDLLDETYNTGLSNGNAIIMGIELNGWKQPVAYHFKKSTIKDELRGVYSYTGLSGDRIRIPAEQILHLFDPEHSNQFRGISHLAPVMIDLHNLKGYDEAAIIAARIGASKTMIIIPGKDEETTGDSEDSEGNVIQNLSFGEIQYGNPGDTVSNWTPDYPREQYAEFVKACYRRIAVALGVNYNSLLSDLEGVNFSSMRSGLLMERDQWFVDQEFIICQFLEVVFARWLRAAQFNSLFQIDKALDLPYNPEKYNQPEFFGRTYPWVDPFKDIQATVLALDNNLTTLTRECKRQGIDFDDMVDERKAEIEKMKEAGIMPEGKTSSSTNNTQMVDDSIDDNADANDNKETKLLKSLRIFNKSLLSFVDNNGNGKH